MFFRAKFFRKNLEFSECVTNVRVSATKREVSKV